jgi:uncharacterized protein YggU (UPF0235/DUF167 family)
MKIVVKAKPRAREEKVEQLTQPTLAFTADTSAPVVYKVSVKESPVNGRANDAIIRALAKHFDIPPACVRLISGQTSRQKIFEISN